MAKLFNRQRNRWRVNERRHFFNMVEKESVKEDLVGVLQSSQVDMPLKIIVFFLKSLVRADHLLVKGFYLRRKKPLPCSTHECAQDPFHGGCSMNLML